MVLGAYFEGSLAFGALPCTGYIEGISMDLSGASICSLQQ